MENFATLDIFVGILLIIGLIRGWRKGFIVEIASLIALVIGVYGAMKFSYLTVDFLEQYINWEDQYLTLTAFCITFFLIVVGVMILGRFFTRLAGLLAMGLFNRLLGAFFSGLKMIFILAAIFVFFGDFNKKANILEDEQLEESVFYMPIHNFGKDILPTLLEKVNTENWEDLPEF